MSPYLLSPEQLGSALPHVLQLAEMHFQSQCLFTVVKLGVPNIIGDETLSVPKIAANIPGKTNEDALLRCMRLLACTGVFEESAGQNGECLFCLTPTGALLQTGLAQPSMACGITHWMEKPMWNAWSNLPDFVAGNFDKPPFESANGQPVFDYYRDHPESADIFHEFMSAFSTAELPIVASDHFVNWESMADKTVVDVGGSLGFVMGAVAEQFPELTCVSFDLPEVIESIEGDGASEDVELVAGDMFDPSSIPKGDVIFMKHILQNWPDKEASRILKACSAAIPQDGKVIVVDPVLPDPGKANAQHKQAFCYDMLSMTIGGQERTHGQWEALAHSAGFKIEQVTKTPLPLCQVIVLTKG